MNWIYIVDPATIEDMKNWMTYINAVRPAANRHWGAGPDVDHHRMAAELSFMSQDDRGSLETSRRERRNKRALVAAIEQTHSAPYDHRMGDRFKPVLSTR